MCNTDSMISNSTAQNLHTTLAAVTSMKITLDPRAKICRFHSSSMNSYHRLIRLGNWLCYDKKSEDPVTVNVVGRIDKRCKTSRDKKDKHADHDHDKHKHDHDHGKDSKYDKYDKYADLETTGFTSTESLCCQKGKKKQFVAGSCVVQVTRPLPEETTTKAPRMESTK